MPKVSKPIEAINKKRLELISLGFVSSHNAYLYLGVGKDKGRAIYKEIKNNLEANGIKVNSCGISTQAFNDYLNITNEQIIAYAKMGL